MIARFRRWVRSKVGHKPYDPRADPVWRMLHDARAEGVAAARASHRARRANRLESVYLHRRLEKQNGAPPYE